MDLSRIMSDGPVRSASQSQNNSPEAQRQSIPLGPPGNGGGSTNGAPPVFGSHTSSAQPTPLYAPSSQDMRLGSGSLPPQKGLTPLQTPTHSQHGAYPFPQQPQQQPNQSPAASQGHRPYAEGGHPQVLQTPGGGQRPQSHGYLQQMPSHPSPGYYTPGALPPSVHHQPLHSHSPTPPSHHSQGHTPHSVRQSPLNSMHHAMPSLPHQHSYPQQQQSQPSTPLGPPPLHYQRTSAHSSHAESPLHQRAFSGASNGVPASPALYQIGIGNLVDSPSAQYRHNHLRRASEHLSERERSVSVSPKTIVQPRPPSLSSRHNSQQDVYTQSARSSLAQQAPPAPLSHHSSIDSQAQIRVQAPQSASESTLRSQGLGEAQIGGQGLHGSSWTQASSMPIVPITPSEHKMGMSNLLSPAKEQPPQPPSIQNAKRPADEIFMKPVKKQVSATPPSPQATTRLPHESLLQQPLHQEQSPVIKMEYSTTDSRKRHINDVDGGSDSVGERPTKAPKKSRRYAAGHRPVWAQLSQKNPFTNGAQTHTNGASQANATSSHPTQPATTVPSSAVPANGDIAQPLDHDLIHARQILGPWEKSFKWNTPYPDMLRVVQDWLVMQLSQHADVGTDPRSGSIEIEAKIGTLIDVATGDRVNYPVGSVCVMRPEKNSNLRFESQMNEREHELMNKYLNETIIDSLVPGRIKMEYKHLYELDTFEPLSSAGLSTLPQSALSRAQRMGRELKLRTTTNTSPKDKDFGVGDVKARIVKLPLADLHIFNPNEPYDCRISMNLEVNLNSPNINPLELVEPKSDERPPPPARKKDRLSYKHLAYSIDLTKVEVQGMAPKYELELEVDATMLRQQLEMLREGRDNAFADVVAGFLDNTAFLMRQRVPG